MTEERRVVTVLFADVTGSTSLGESIDPEALRGLLGRYFAIAREVMEAHGGTVEKFIGDAVMAVFGLPVAHGDDTPRALAAALELRDRVRGDPALGDRLPIRLGVNSGEVIASRDAAAMDFLVTGDAVNVAARLEQAAEPWSILVGERSVHAAPTGFAFRSLEPIEARGKALPIRASELLGRAAPIAGRHTPLVGRRADLAQLELVADRAFGERRPFLVSVIAAPGVGKSRLLEEFVDRLPGRHADALVAIAQCLPYGQRLTYWPLRALLFELLELPDDTPPEEVGPAARRWLRAAGDETPERTADLLAATIGAAELEQVDRSALFAAWRSTVELAAARRPLVLVVEDLHWSSDSLLDLVEFILQPRGESALLMVALARPELLDRRPGWGGGRRNYVSLALEPLGDGEVAQLVTNLLDGPAPEIVRSVVARAEGNPFYAGEIVRAIVERVPDLRDPAAVNVALAGLPDSVHTTILARLDVLPPAARRLLQLGAVFGRAFRTAGVVALDPALAGVASPAVDELIERDLVRTAGRDQVTFRHILIREVAYGTLTRAERIRLHEAAGSWLETSAGTDVEAIAELVAYHYREAISLAQLIGQPVDDASRRRASAWLVRAADVALAGAAVLEASRHLRAAIDMADPDELPELYLKLGESQLGGNDSIEACARAYELGLRGGRSPDFLLKALALRLLAMARWTAAVARQVSNEEFEHLRTEARALFDRATDERTRAEFLIFEAFVPFWLGNRGQRPTAATLAAAEESGRLGLQIAERLDDPVLMSAALDGLGAVAASAGRPEVALVHGRRRVSFEDRLSLQERLDAHNVVAWQASLLGDFVGAIETADQGLSVVQPGQDPLFALAVANWRPYAMTLLGRWDEVPAAIDRCRQLWIEGERAAAGYALSGIYRRGRRRPCASRRWTGALVRGGRRDRGSVRRGSSDPAVGCVSRTGCGSSRNTGRRPLGALHRAPPSRRTGAGRGDRPRPADPERPAPGDPRHRRRASAPAAGGSGAACPRPPGAESSRPAGGTGIVRGAACDTVRRPGAGGTCAPRGGSQPARPRDRQPRGARRRGPARARAGAQAEVSQVDERREIVIVGGGIMGASALFEFARRGVDALLLERDPSFGGRDSSKTAGIIRTHYSNPEVVRMAIRGREIFRDLPSLTGGPAVLHDIGYVFLASVENLDGARSNVAMQRLQGATVEELGPSELGRFAPGASTAGVGALFYEAQSGYADPVPAAEAFVEAARAQGATARCGVEVHELVRDGDRITGVTTEQGFIPAGAVVLAAGAWSRPLAATAGVDLPVTWSVEQELLLSVPSEVAPTASISNSVDAVYEHPELGVAAGAGRTAVLVGTGFPKEYPRGDPAMYPEQDAKEDLVDELRRRLAIRQPGLADAEIVSARLGLYDITPDWHPYLGPTAQAEGLLLFTGGSGHGFKIAPAMAEMLASAWCGTPVDYAAVDQFSVDRIAARTSQFASRYGGNRA